MSYHHLCTIVEHAYFIKVHFLFLSQLQLIILTLYFLLLSLQFPLCCFILPQIINLFVSNDAVIKSSSMNCVRQIYRNYFILISFSGIIFPWIYSSKFSLQIFSPDEQAHLVS